MATVASLVVDQGSRFRLVVDVTVDWLTDLTGYSARGTVRLSQSGPGFDLVLTDLSPYLTVDVGNDQVVLEVPADISAAYDWTRGHYDLELYDGNPAHDVRFLQGEIRVDKEVTV